jgi:branched-chain amino acid aminotransferase
MKDGTIRTPCLNDTILNGVTRASVMELATRRGIKVEERDYFFKDFYADVMRREVSEVFACGTAGGLIAIGSFYCPSTTDSESGSSEFLIGDGEMGHLTKKLRLELLGIQNGTREDSLGWLHEICGEDLPHFS